MEVQITCLGWSDHGGWIGAIWPCHVSWKRKFISGLGKGKGFIFMEVQRNTMESAKEKIAVLKKQQTIKVSHQHQHHLSW